MLLLCMLPCTVYARKTNGNNEDSIRMARKIKARDAAINNAEFIFEGAERTLDIYYRDSLGRRKNYVKSEIINVTKVLRGNIKPGTIELIGTPDIVMIKPERISKENAISDSVSLFFCNANKEYNYDPKYDIYPLDNKKILSLCNRFSSINFAFEKVDVWFGKTFHTKAEVYNSLKTYHNIKIPELTKADNDTFKIKADNYLGGQWQPLGFKAKRDSMKTVRQIERAKRNARNDSLWQAKTLRDDSIRNDWKQRTGMDMTKAQLDSVWRHGLKKKVVATPH